MNVKNESLDFPYDRNKEGFIRKKLYLDIFKICSVPRARNFFSVMHLQKSASFCEIVFYYFILVVLPSFPKKILGTLVHVQFRIGYTNKQSNTQTSGNY